MSRSQSQSKSKRTGGRALGRLPLAVAVYMACQGMAFAQDAPAQSTDAQPPPAQQQAPTLETITVTAQKREEDLQKVPISIQAIGNQDLERHDVAAFNDYAKLIPSVSFGTAGGGVFSRLEKSIEIYARGSYLKRHCEEKLRTASERIEKIVDGPNGPKAVPADLD